MLHPHYYLRRLVAKIKASLFRLLSPLRWAVEHKEFERDARRRLEEAYRERAQLAYDINFLQLRVFQRVKR